MAITYPSVHYAENLGTNGGTSGTTTTTGADLLVIAVKWEDFVGGGASPPLPTDSNSNTWAGGTTYGSNSQKFIRMYYSKAPTVGAGHTFTVTMTSGNIMLAVVGFVGTHQTAPFDQQDGAGAIFQNSIQAATGITPSEAGCVVVSAAFAQSGTGTSTIDGGFTETDDQNGFATSSEDILMAYLIQTSPAAARPTTTQDSGTSTYEATAMMSFLPAPAASIYTVTLGPALIGGQRTYRPKPFVPGSRR